MGDQEPREQVEQSLTQLEQNGWMLREPVERIWQGERALAALTAGLDKQDTARIKRVLELVGEYERGERELPTQALAAVPEAVRAAIVSNDGAALHAALTALPGTEAQAIIARLNRAGVIPEPPQRQPSATEQQIAELRAQVEQAVVQVLAGNDDQQRAALAVQLDQVAQQVEQQPDEGWQELAAHLRGLKAQLES